MRMARRRVARFTLVAGASAFLIGSFAVESPAAPKKAVPVTFTNSAPITINDTTTDFLCGTATPYPSTIAASGLGTSTTSVSVQLNSFDHAFPDDVGVVLVGPGGQALLLMDGAGDDPDMVDVTFTIADSGASALPDLTAWTAGTYRPTAYYTGDSFPAPGPGTGYGNPGPAGGGTATLNGTYGGTNPNGTWSLYVCDFIIGDAGDFSGGWAITIDATSPPPPPSAPQPKNVSLKANKKIVFKGKKVKLTAVVSPCAGHEGDNVNLNKGANTLQTKASDSSCTAVFRVKMKRKATFRAVSPVQDADHLAGTSNPVKVRVKRRT